jgi:hypothetical protein
MFNRPFHRAVVLIDGMFLQNILNELGLFGKVDFRKLSDKLTGPDHVRAGTHVFDSLPENPAPFIIFTTPPLPTIKNRYLPQHP